MKIGTAHLEKVRARNRRIRLVKRDYIDQGISMQRILKKKSIAPVTN